MHEAPHGRISLELLPCVDVPPGKPLSSFRLPKNVPAQSTAGFSCDFRMVHRQCLCSWRSRQEVLKHLCRSSLCQALEMVKVTFHPCKYSSQQGIYALSSHNMCLPSIQGKWRSSKSFAYIPDKERLCKGC